MKRTLTPLIAVLAVCQCFGQTLVTTSPVSNDAYGTTVAKFTSTEGTPRTIIRIAYVDGVSSGAPGTDIYIRDYDFDDDMELIGERKITYSGPTTRRYTKPRLSRDGRGIVFYGNTQYTGSYPTIPFYALLASTPYSGTGTVTATEAPYGGVDGENDLGSSTTLFETADVEPPAISNITGSSFYIVFPDLLAETVEPEEEPNAPLMFWDTASSVSGVSGTNNCILPAISNDGEDLAFVNGDHVYHAEGDPGVWTDDLDVVSYYNGNYGNGASTLPEMDGSGNVVVFVTAATNLRSSDTNGMRDVYTWTEAGGPVLAYNDPGSFFKAKIDHPSISPDGEWVSFECSNENFLSGSVDYSDRSGLYVYRVPLDSLGSIEIVSYEEDDPIIARYGNYSSITNGGHTVFQTSDTGIVDGDTRTGFDIIYRG